MGMVGKFVRLVCEVETLGGRTFPKGARFRVSHLKKGKFTVGTAEAGEAVYLHGVPRNIIELEAEQSEATTEGTL